MYTRSRHTTPKYTAKEWDEIASDDVIYRGIPDAGDGSDDNSAIDLRYSLKFPSGENFALYSFTLAIKSGLM